MTEIDCYPWAAPTEEQMEMFEQLSPKEQLEMIRRALRDVETLLSGRAFTTSTK